MYISRIPISIHSAEVMVFTSSSDLQQGSFELPEEVRKELRDAEKNLAAGLWLRTPCACLEGPDFSTRHGSTWSAAEGAGVPLFRTLVVLWHY